MSETHREYVEAMTSKFKANESLVKYRLDPEPLLQRIEAYLKGIKKIQYFQDGEPVTEMIQVAKPKLNENGINCLINEIQSTVTTQIVQGNFLTQQDWREFVADFRRHITRQIALNLEEWAMPLEDGKPDIDNYENNMEGLIDYICNIVEPFMTRLIFDKERESYRDTMQTSESNVIQKKGGFPFFNKN